MITLGQARARFSRYAGSNNSFTDQINEVIERLLPLANGKGTTVPIRMVVYEDRYGNNVITLPRDYETILAGAYQASDEDRPNMYWCGKPLPIRNAWHDFLATGPGNVIGTDSLKGIEMMPGRYTTFADWSTEMRLRVVCEQDESPGGMIIFRGRLEGSKVFTPSGGRSMEGIPLNFTTTAPVTTTLTLDEPPYQIIKPVTKGRIRFYAVDADDVATLVGDYEPDETNPSYLRYKVPVCPHT